MKEYEIVNGKWCVRELQPPTKSWVRKDVYKFDWGAWEEVLKTNPRKGSG